MPPGKSQCALGQGQAPRGNMSSCPRTALLLTSCARAMAAGTPSCSASVLGGMMCHGRRPLKLLPVHAGPRPGWSSFLSPGAHTWSCSSQGLELCARLCPSPSGVWPFRASGTTAEQRGKQRGRRGRGRPLVTAAQRDHPRGCGPLHSPVPPDGGGARGEPSRAPAGLRSGPRAPAAALHS